MNDRIAFTGKSWTHLNKSIAKWKSLGYRVTKQHRHPDGGTTITMEK
jgi:hypothetical protein